MDFPIPAALIGRLHRAGPDLGKIEQLISPRLATRGN